MVNNYNIEHGFPLPIERRKNSYANYPMKNPFDLNLENTSYYVAKRCL